MQPVGALIETLLRFGHTDTIILCLSKINVKIWILDPLASFFGRQENMYSQFLQKRKYHFVFLQELWRGNFL